MIPREGKIVINLIKFNANFPIFTIIKKNNVTEYRQTLKKLYKTRREIDF